VSAARAAFSGFSSWSREERLALLHAVIAAYENRLDDMAAAIHTEMGAPLTFARAAQVGMGLAQLKSAADALERFAFEELQGTTLIRREPIGVCALITPWNWPANQIACKVAPALATGCTMILKPSELAPRSASLFAQILHDAGVPAGVFNLVHGDGLETGQDLASHPAVDMVSFTGSTRGGVAVATAAAPTVKRVTQELGGKSPVVILDDADLDNAISSSIAMVMMNSGQTCAAGTRLLVPAALHGKACELAAASAVVEGENIGPVVSRPQWDHIQELIESGIAEGARVIAGGPGLPAGRSAGFYVQPTVLADVSNDMRVAREEIFGPVAVIIPYTTEEQAIAIANDTPYGLAGAVHSRNMDRARNVANRIQTGQVTLNAAPLDLMAPFGGYKQSGNGREWGKHGFAEYLEVKSVVGHGVLDQ
jgi:aldehyde dehydrogenase (NAD+)